MRASFLPGPRARVAERIARPRLARDRSRPTAPCWRPAASTSRRCWKAWRCPADIVGRRPIPRARPAGSTSSPASSPTMAGPSTRSRPAMTGPLYAEIGAAHLPGAGARRLAPVADPLPHGRCARRRRRAARPAAPRCASSRRRTRTSRAASRCRSTSTASATRTAHRRLPRQAPHRPSSTSTRRGACDLLDFWEPIARARARRPHPRSRRVLHPRLEGGGARAARLRGRDGAVRSAGGRVPRALCWLLRPGLRPCAPDGLEAARAVLEVRSREVPFILEDGQIVGRLVYERMAERPADPLRRRPRLELSGPGPEALQAFSLRGQR